MLVYKKQLRVDLLPVLSLVLLHNKVSVCAWVSLRSVVHRVSLLDGCWAPHSFRETIKMAIVFEFEFVRCTVYYVVLLSHISPKADCSSSGAVELLWMDTEIELKT